MAITQDFRSIPLDKLIDTCKERKNEGYRLAQLCPKLERDDSITLIYTFVKESEMINYKVSGIKKGVTEVPSVTEFLKTKHMICLALTSLETLSIFKASSIPSLRELKRL